MAAPPLDPNSPPHLGILLRLVWMLGGPAAIYVALALVAVRGDAFPSTLDLVVWGAVALVLAVRWIDVVHCRGQTAQGDPATLAHWRRFAVLVVLIAAAGSALAHSLAGV